MRRMSGCRAVVGMAVAFLAWPGLLHADPFAERPIPLPLEDGHDIAIADFNGDGLPDVATLDSYGPFIAECNQPPGPIDCPDQMLLTVALNEGQGHFAPVSTTPAMCLPWTLAAGDFDADGRTDVIIGNRGARDYFGVCDQPSVSFYPGTGDGGFGTPQHLVLVNEPMDMAAGDFDGDGVPEVAMIEIQAGGALHILRVTAGVFTDGPTKTFADPLSAVAVGDLGSTGRDEIVVAYGNQKVVTRLSLVLGTLLTGETCGLEVQYPLPASLLVADLVGDAAPEIVAGQPNQFAGDHPFVTLLRRGEAGSYCGPTDAISSAIPAGYGGSLATGDLNADGIPDLATTDGVYQVVSLFGDGNGRFLPPPLPDVTSGAADEITGGLSESQTTSGRADKIVGGDLDGNGIDDLAVTGSSLGGPFETVALLNQFPGPGLMMLGMDEGNVTWHGVVGALSYDVVRGDIETLRATAGNYTAALEACVANDVAATGSPLSGDPPLGHAWWILGRANLPGGPGTYDEWGGSQAGPRDAGINASALACH